MDGSGAAKAILNILDEWEQEEDEERRREERKKGGKKRGGRRETWCFVFLFSASIDIWINQ